MAEEKKEKKKIKPHRVQMPKQTPEERVRNFNEVALGRVFTHAGLRQNQFTGTTDAQPLNGWSDYFQAYRPHGTFYQPRLK